MFHAKTRVLRLGVLVAGLALLSTACGGEDSGGTSSSDALSGTSFTVGSKEFTEQLILGQMTLLALEDAGADVTDETGITGSTNVRKALEADQIDLYWEYTGTGWTTYLGHEAAAAPTDEQALYEQVAKEDLAKSQVEWFGLSEVNNTYAIATSSSASEELGVTSLSDYAGVANSNPTDASLCAASEFLDRADGWPGVAKAYGFDLPDEEITEVELGIIFTQVPEEDGDCNFGEVFATDGRIPANDMVVLEDDQDFFVKYNLAITANQAVLEENPEVQEILTPIAEALTTETMADLNAQVDVDGLPVEDVAQTWLEDNGFLG